MSQDRQYAYNSFIKNIYLKIPGGYRFRHQSYGDDEGSLFLGRQEILASFVDILCNGSNQGAYLVTGYRGMGKTSFVNKALTQYKSQKTANGFWHKWNLWVSNQEINSHKAINDFRLSLAQSELKEVDILKHIVNQLIDKVEHHRDFQLVRWFSLNNVFSWLWPLITTGFLLINFSLVYSGGQSTAATNTDSSELKTVIENLLGIVSLSALATLFLYKIADWLHAKYLQNIPRGRRAMEAFLLMAAAFWLWLFFCVRFVFYSPDTEKIVLYLLAFAGIFALTIKFITFFGKRKYQTIKQIHTSLKLLHSRCNAQVTSEDQFRDTFSSSVAALFKKDVLIYPIANPREIETELIAIIGQLKPYMECIFVFDELDKVDPNSDWLSSSDSAKKGSDQYTLLNDLRERRHLITHILGSLKYFINEAHAKFIFIAGREMFEAALADISDRQSSISSIFHRVIYVDSFLKDQSDGETMASSIGVLVERRLAQLLLPALAPKSNALPLRSFNRSTNQPGPQPSFFLDYYQYLTGTGKYATRAITDPPALSTKEAQKIISTLQNFLVFLVYRSNGSPKKVTRLLEEFVSCESLVMSNTLTSRNIVFGELPASGIPTHYLYFSHHEQYKLGFTAYLFQPFLTMYSTFMKQYSDSTLVSTPYLIDNLIKFHPFAFSAQNLELIPEILSTNKSPISRPFLEELITFLAQNHIRRTESGLFEYKFYDRTHNEITFISKIFEDDAAAFNFTLDENFSVKAHLIAKIRQLRETHSNKGEYEAGAENPVSSIIFLNRMLGDVRFQDEEYEDAIVSYQDAIQMLTHERLEYANYLITYVRLKLKLGLTYEKIKAHEFALGHYAGVIEEAGSKMFEFASKHDVVYRELLMLVMQSYSATLYLQEKLQEGITFQKIKNVMDGFTGLVRGFKLDYDNRDILVASFYGNVGTALYYKNIVLPQKVNELRFDVLNEKKKLIPADPAQAVLAANRLARKEQAAEQALLNCFPPHPQIEPEFIRASLKELVTIDDPIHRIHPDARISFSTYLYYKLTLQKLLGCTTKIELGEILGECPRLIYFQDGQASYRSLQQIRRLTSIGHALAKLGDYLLPLAQRKVAATDALGCFYASNESDGPLEAKAREKLLTNYFVGDAAKKDLNGTLHPRLIVHIYYLASLFFLDGAETANGAFQLRKILFTLRSLKLTISPTDGNGTPVNEVLNSLEANLVKRILELSSWMSHSSDRPQLSKTKKYVAINTLRTPHSVSSQLYGNLSNSPDSKETVLAYALLRTQYHEYNPNTDSLWDCFETHSERKLLSPYGSIAHQIIRLMELELHTNMNYKLLNTYISTSLQTLISGNDIPVIIGNTATQIPFGLVHDPDKPDDQDNWEDTYFYACNLYNVLRGEYVEGPDAGSVEEKFNAVLNWFANRYKKSNNGQMDSKDREGFQNWVREYAGLVVNSIFNLIQVDRIINTYGINYILSYSYMAKVHHHLGTWLKHLHLCRILQQKCALDIETDTLLNELIGPQMTSSLDTLTSYQVAIQYYYQAIQLHKEGNAYRHQINNLIYLEDDYNDNLYHFGAALERFRINSGSVRKQITSLKQELQKASMYKYNTYIGKES